MNLIHFPFSVEENEILETHPDLFLKFTSKWLHPR